MRDLLSYCSRMCFALALEPLKLLLHFFIIIATLPWGHTTLGQMSLSWIGFQFPPKLALTCSRTRDDSQVSSIPEGSILVAAPGVPRESVFHRAVILLLENSHDGARGVVLNLNSSNFHQQRRILHGYEVGYGGPLERNRITVLHDCRDLKYEADFSYLSEGVFVEEYGSTVQRGTGSTFFVDPPHINRASPAASHSNNSNTISEQVQQNVRRLIRACHRTARRAQNRFSNVANAANRWATTIIRDADAAGETAAALGLGLVGMRIGVSRQQSAATNLINHMGTIKSTSPGSDGGESDARGHTINRRASQWGRRTVSEEALHSLPAEGPRPIQRQLQQQQDRERKPGSEQLPISDDNSGISTIGNIRIVQGATLWLPHQLDGEAAQGIWHVLPLRHRYAFPDPAGMSRDDLWTELMLQLEDRDPTMANADRPALDFFKRFELNVEVLLDAIFRY